MSILQVENVSHDFGGRTILEEASFRLLNGEHIGLVGANGEGKSTFLNIITGKITPDSGKIEWCKRITTGYLDQHTTLQAGKTIYEVLQEAFSYYYDLEQEMMAMYEQMCDCDDDTMAKLMEEVGEIQDILEHGSFYTIDVKIKEIASGLGLTGIGLDKLVDELSGGQRSKVLLTKLLLQNPMILILDEPTNYLDEQHIEWLIGFLKNYENAFILVSHDIPFLNQVINVIYHLDQGELTRYKGDYDYYLQQVELKQKQQVADYNKQQKEIADLEDFIARNKARVATRNMASSRQKKLDKMDLISKPKTKVKPTFRFLEARTPGKVLFSCVDLVIGYESPLTTPINIEFERNRKVAIKGVNGLGKTTLLKTLIGMQKPYSGHVEKDPFVQIGFFKQEEAAVSKTALDYLWDEFPDRNNGEIRGMLAACGLTTDHIESLMKVLSGGENAKVRICKIMNREANILVLDEPTNHLDSDAKESLQEAIKAFKGAVILVSHEPEFYLPIVDEVINLEDSSTKII